MTSPDWNRSPDGNRKWHPYPARTAFIVLHNAAESAVCSPVIHCVRVPVSRNARACVRACSFLRLDVTSLPRSIAIKARKAKNFARQTEVCYFISKRTKSVFPVPWRVRVIILFRPFPPRSTSIHACPPFFLFYLFARARLFLFPFSASNFIIKLERIDVFLISFSFFFIRIDLNYLKWR